MSELIDRARIIATAAHRNQFRRDGVTPYIVHPCAVAKKLAADGESDETVAAGWLHDVLEDTDETVASLLAREIPPSVVRVVEVLTHSKNERYIDYIRRVVRNEKARRVKMADILCNLADDPTEEQIAKYSRAMLVLTGYAD